MERRSLWLGLVIIAIGIVWLLNNLGITEVSLGNLITTYWPVILVLMGLDLLIKERRESEEGSKEAGISRGRMIWVIVLVALGLVILGRNLGLYSFSLSIVWAAFWPIVLILVGLALLRSSSGPGTAHWAVMSGTELKNRGWKLEDGQYVALMGGIEMDLTVAEIPERDVTLNLTAVMGGIDIRIPDNLAIECQGTAVLGGFTFLHEEGGGIFASRTYSHTPDDAGKRRLILRATAIMGGVDVKR